MTKYLAKQRTLRDDGGILLSNKNCSLFCSARALLLGLFDVSIFLVYINNLINALQNSIIHNFRDVSYDYKKPVVAEEWLARRGQKWNNKRAYEKHS